MDERKEILRSSHTIDLSRTGVGFVSTRFVPINSKLMVELSLSRGENPVLVQGCVKWVEKIPNSQNFRVGMNFSDISTDTQSRIEKYFKS
jgi:c-di-GMP-binding flagellar brake protein YcgR